MQPKNPRKIVAFDFDDTLAETNSLIGVRLLPADQDLEEGGLAGAVGTKQHHARAEGDGDGRVR